MAQLVGIVHTSHGGFTTIPSEHWGTRRGERSYRSDVPQETQEEMDQKWALTLQGIATLRAKVNELKPDVLVIFDHQYAHVFHND